MFSPRAKVVVSPLALSILPPKLQSAPADWTSIRAEYRIIAKALQDAGLYFRVEQPLTADDSSIPGYQAELGSGIMYGKQKWVREGKLFAPRLGSDRRQLRHGKTPSGREQPVPPEPCSWMLAVIPSLLVNAVSRGSGILYHKIHLRMWTKV